MMESRFNELVTKYGLHGDGLFYRYDMLAKAAADAPEGIFVEIGFRAGTGVMAMVEGKPHSPNNLYIAIDPFGNVPYNEGTRTRHLDYTNERRKYTLRNFYNYLAEVESTTNFIFFNLESIEFIKRYEDGVPDYFSGNKVIRTDYSIAHLDGQHDTETVLKEVEFFVSRILPNGYIIIDNTEQGWMDMEPIEKVLYDNGFTKHELTAYDKWAYKKVNNENTI